MSDARVSAYRAFLLGGVFRGEEELFEHFFRMFGGGGRVKGELSRGSTHLADVDQHNVLDIGDVAFRQAPALGGAPQVDIGAGEADPEKLIRELSFGRRDVHERLVFHAVMASLLGPLAGAARVVLHD